MSTKGVAWSLQDEVKFYKELGSHSAQMGLTKTQLQERYRKAIKARKEWGQINPRELETSLWNIEVEAMRSWS